uniref:Uncharacterized protein n=1 Tax=Tetraselmis sp. GSL018 TaxID=582737 RepID=A0A061SCN4_9CHLO
MYARGSDPGVERRSQIRSERCPFSHDDVSSGKASNANPGKQISEGEWLYRELRATGSLQAGTSPFWADENCQPFDEHNLQYSAPEPSTLSSLPPLLELKTGTWRHLHGEQCPPTRVAHYAPRRVASRSGILQQPHAGDDRPTPSANGQALSTYRSLRRGHPPTSLCTSRTQSASGGPRPEGSQTLASSGSAPVAIDRLLTEHHKRVARARQEGRVVCSLPADVEAARVRAEERRRGSASEREEQFAAFQKGLKEVVKGSKISVKDRINPGVEQQWDETKRNLSRNRSQQYQKAIQDCESNFERWKQVRSKCADLRKLDPKVQQARSRAREALYFERGLNAQRLRDQWQQLKSATQQVMPRTSTRISDEGKQTLEEWRQRLADAKYRRQRDLISRKVESELQRSKLKRDHTFPSENSNHPARSMMSHIRP